MLIYVSAPVRERAYFYSELHEFARGVLRHVTRARHHGAHAIQCEPVMFRHRLSKVHSTMTSCFSASKRATEKWVLPSQGSFISVSDAFVHAIHIPNLATTDTDIPRWHIALDTNVSMEL